MGMNFIPRPLAIGMRFIPMDGEMRALEEHKKGKKAKWYHFVFRPAYKFFNHYILRLGILDGKKGIIICYLNALGVWQRYSKLKKLNKQKN